MNTTAKFISDLFQLKIIGNQNRRVSKISSLKKQDSNSLLWAKKLENLKLVRNGVVICCELDFNQLVTKNEEVTYLLTQDSPRLIFSKVTSHFVGESKISFNNQVENYKTREDLQIGDYCFIGPNVSIGKGTIIYPNVVIHPGSKIGENCIIKSFCSIGSEGLGYELDNDQLVKFPQLGGVIIENDVEIGPNATIRRAAIDNTIVKKGCKIGSFVNIGHNCVIEENVIMTCQVVTSGGSIIKKNVFMGVNSSVKEKVVIEENATIGQGAVIIRNVNKNEIVVGNPGKVIGIKK